MGVINRSIMSTGESAQESGRIRAPVRKDNRVGLTKKQKTMLASSSSSSSSSSYSKSNKNLLSSGTTNGLSSSLVFTPVQGLELINPNAVTAADRVREANKKWFNSSSGFLSAVPKGK